ncbi:hypothetical protein ACWGDT_43950 [Streptomyces avermitilis]
MGNQRLVRRSVAFYRIPLVLLASSFAFLIWSVVQKNVSAPLSREWPWRLVLLDIQSSANACLIIGGFMFARSQYARAVRPYVGWSGRTEVSGGRTVWEVTAKNHGSGPIVVFEPSYQIKLRSASGAIFETSWLEWEEVRSELRNRISDPDSFFLLLVRPIAYMTDSGLPLMRFSPDVLSVIEDVLVKFEFKDVSGDTYETVVHGMRGAREQHA